MLQNKVYEIICFWMPTQTLILDEEGYWRETLKRTGVEILSYLYLSFYWNSNTKLIAGILHKVQIAASNWPYW